MKNPKIKFTEIQIGSGALAEGDVRVKVHTRIFLNRGEEVKGLWGADADGISFRLRDREIIPGLRSAVDGMRVGGRRMVTIPPHLAFGKIGLPGNIPPDAVLQGEFELLEVDQPGERTSIPPEHRKGRCLSIMASGEESSRFPRWHLVFHDRHHPHHPSKSSLHLEWSTRSDGKWGSRSAQRRSVELTLDSDEIDWMIDVGKQLPQDHASECLHYDNVHTHGGYSPTRANADSVICWSVSLVENGEYQAVCYLRENSPLWTGTDWGKRVMNLVQPHLTEAPWRMKASERNL